MKVIIIFRGVSYEEKRYYRLISEYTKAEEVIQKGLKEAKDNPVALANLWHERARIALCTDDLEAENLYREKGNTIYRNSGLINRVIEKQMLEYGELFTK